MPNVSYVKKVAPAPIDEAIASSNKNGICVVRQKESTKGTRSVEDRPKEILKKMARFLT
jgi:hypothetical protein